MYNLPLTETGLQTSASRVGARMNEDIGGRWYREKVSRMSEGQDLGTEY